MKKTLRRPYYYDMVTVSVFLAVTWLVMIFAVYEIIGLASSNALKAMIVISGGITIVFATVSLVAVMVHLYRGRELLYREDMAHRKDFKGGKNGR